MLGIVSRLPVASTTFVVILLLAVVATAKHGGQLLSDQAIIELRIRELFTTNTSLTGPYSRFGPSHPGPVMYWVLAPGYYLLGQSGSALMLSAGFINASTAAVTVGIVENRSRLLAMGLAVATALLILGTPEELLANPWNPRLITIAALLFFVSAVFAADGDGFSFGVAIVSFLFVASSHAGVGLALGPTAVVATVLWIRQRRRVPPAWALAVLAIGLAPVVFDIVTGWPGNAGELVRFALSDGQPRVGVSNAARLVARSMGAEFAVAPSYDRFFGIVVPRQSLGWTPALMLVGLIVAGWKSSSSTIRLAGRLHLVAVLGALLSISGSRVPVFSYLFVFLHPIALVGWLIVAAAVVHELDLVNREIVPRVGYATALIFAVGLLLTIPSPLAEDHINGQGVEAVMGVAVSELGIPDRFIMSIEGGSDFTSISLFGGLLNQFDQAGFDVKVTPETESIVGQHRRGADDPTLHVFLESVSGQSGFTGEEVVVLDPLDGLERNEADLLVAKLTDALGVAQMSEWVGSLDSIQADEIPIQLSPVLLDQREDFERLAELRRKGHRLVVTLTD